MTVLTPEENQTQHGTDCDVGKAYGKFLREKKSPIKSLINSECESVLSDYSEIAGPLEDIENDLEVYIVDRRKLKTGDFVLNTGNTGSKEIERISGETDLEFAKRARKINILSLAQEFAELKKIDARALPFDLHKGQRSVNEVSENGDESSGSEPEEYLTESAMTSPVKEVQVVPNGEMKLNPGLKDPKSTSPKPKSRDGSRHRGKHGRDRKANVVDDEVDSVMSSSGDFDVYNIESTLPQMDWATLEQQLQLAAEEEKKRLLVRVIFLVCFKNGVTCSRHS